MVGNAQTVGVGVANSFRVVGHSEKADRLRGSGREVPMGEMNGFAPGCQINQSGPRSSSLNSRRRASFSASTATVVRPDAVKPRIYAPRFTK